MRLNVAPSRPHGSTHEGAPAAPANALAQLRRSVLSCLLWEREFYEDGEEIAARIYRLAKGADPIEVAVLAKQARGEANLRHVPLVLLSALAATELGRGVLAHTIEHCVQRADELAELLVVHAKLNGVTPDKVKKIIPAQMKKGLARAFRKFNAYQLAKYNRPGAVTLKDVLFLCHAKAKDIHQRADWEQLIDGSLPSPDTWEVELSAGKDKKETFERLITEGKLGYLALLRNLRGMMDAGVERDLVTQAILARKGAERVLPFRYVAAARACPQLEPVLDIALRESIAELPPLPGMTAIMVDVSDSMNAPLSAKSDLKRMDAAAALASMWPGTCRILTFSYGIQEVPPRKGMAGVDAIIRSQPHGGTFLGAALDQVNKMVPYDRIVVITDEQSQDAVGWPVVTRDVEGKPTHRPGYMINVASAKNGVGYGAWTRIDGFSEGVLRFIHEHEQAARE